VEAPVTWTGAPLAVSLQSCVAKVEASILPAAVTQSMISWRISTWAL
jgi:hypothetical protein